MTRRLFAVVIVCLLAVTPAFAQETQRQYLSGKGSDDAVPWEFFCSAGAKSGEWTTIPVPSCWDALGFGTLNYKQDGQTAEQGKYRHRFTLPHDLHEGKTILLVFDGVMTDATVTLNGQPAGPTHRGAFYRFSYDVTQLAKFDGENVLEVTVVKKSADESVNRAERQADYWVFGGIFRPVWIEARPVEHIERVAIDARADGSLAVEVFPGEKITSAKRVEVEVDGRKFSAPLDDVKTRVEGKLDNPKLWTAETPNLYTMQVRLLDGDDKVLHRLDQRFGFRTIEVRVGDGVYLNGKRIILKGANRHTFWPESGRTTSEKISREDVKLIKEGNHNAVRMSHYPPDEHFLDACDEAGVYVLDELAGWQKSYDEPNARRLVGEMIRRDVNHPSILFWDNGNEGGWNTAVDEEFAKWDPQRREVLHPWELFRKVNTRHYRSFEEHVKLCAGPDVYLPTEFLHGLFDGGMGAGLAEYWDATLKSKVAAGGFLWALVDEAVKRPDTGKMDTAGNAAPDGIVGPYRQKEASYYAVKEIWSPVVVKKIGEREIEVENRYDFTNLDRCRFRLEGRTFYTPLEPRSGHRVTNTSEVKVAAAPGEKVRVELPSGGGDADALALQVDDPDGRELWTWVWPLRETKLAAAPIGPATKLPFARSVRAVPESAKLTRAEWADLDDGSGVELDYAYTLDGKVDFHGIAFDVKDDDVRSIRWLGQGPHRVWKNRLTGTHLGVFATSSNDTITGYQGWNYPEFAGCYAGVRWMRLWIAAGSVVIEPSDPAVFVQVGKPKFPGEPKPFSPTTAATRRAPTSQLAGNAWANLPDTGLAILHAIPPIGSKFQLANTTGPQGQQTEASGEYRGRVRFYFGR